MGAVEKAVMDLAAARTDAVGGVIGGGATSSDASDCDDSGGGGKNKGSSGD